MIEKRRVRFACIDGIERSDIGIAAEVWLDDIARRSWATREVLKLATLMKRYMTGPDPRDMVLRTIERMTGLDRKMMQEALRQMQMFGVVEGYGIDGDIVRVSLTLTVLQRLRVLEVRHRLHALGAPLADAVPAASRNDMLGWIPEAPPEPDDGETGEGQPELVAEPA